MSWMSPLTVASTTVPRLTVPPSFWARVSRITSKAAWAAPADWMSWGRKTLFCSKSAPTRSRAGMRTLSTMSMGSRVSRRALVAGPASPFKPVRTISVRSRFPPAAGAGAAVPVVVMEVDTWALP